MRWLGLVFLVLVFAPSVWAEESELVSRFRQAALNAVARAESQGEIELQNISLPQVRRVILTSTVVHYPNVSLRIGNRRCARWQPGTVATNSSGQQVNVAPHIYLNKTCAQLGIEELEGIALHEFLGLGFEADKNYEITSRILSGGIKKSEIFDEKKAAEIMRELQKSRSGGSTGVGGGGDEDDLRFKLAGLRYLRSAGAGGSFGIPTEVLEYIIREMSVSPAKDIDHLLEFRAAGIEKSNSSAIIYVASDIYRDKDAGTDRLGLLAVTAAQVFAMHAASDFGLSDIGPFTLSKERKDFIDKITRFRLYHPNSF